MSSSERKFESKPAKRERVPLLIGLVGPSSSGKTYSALRLAAGIERVTPGKTHVIDSEAKRALHYSDRFKFMHTEFVAPFGPLDYLAAVEHCVKQGATTIIIDSASHLHEGPGGVLEMHQQEVDRLSSLWRVSADKAQIPAWAKPKQELRRFLNAVLQLPVNLIFCFRAKEKVAIKTGEKPKHLGFMPIASDEMVYEMTLNCLLYPGSGGVPSWHPEEMGEKGIVKLPEQFKGIFTKSKPLDEDAGEALARWAAGDASAQPTAAPTRKKADVAAEIYAALADIQMLDEASAKAWLADMAKERFQATGATVTIGQLDELLSLAKEGACPERAA